MPSDAMNYETLFDKAPCGYVLADKDGRIVRSNQTFLAWTGHVGDEILGKRFSDLLPIGGKIFYETHFAPSLHMQGNFSEVALDIVGRDGSKIQVLANAALLPASDDGPAVIHFAIFRAAERRMYEKGLLEARDKAEEAIKSERADSELREQFIAVLGHDLRNPLASITSGVHMLGKESLSERGNKVVGLMMGSVVRASALIDNVLDFARGRLGGGITLARSSKPLEPALRQVVSELRSVSPGRTITAHYEIDEPIDCDHTRIGQLLSNLLGNALTHGAKDLPVQVDAKRTEHDLVIAVTNGGKPIPAKALERLFQPFFRGNERLQHGLGLGLHIASEIARAHGGTLVARSDKIATTFILTMPIAQANK
jgi:sigma-B regulation protein RsbU (phosphoserine phosphatase)